MSSGRFATPDSAFNEANSLFVDEQYEEALELYNDALNIDESRADIYVKRAACHIKLESYTDAVADANSALSLQPDNVTALLRKGIACFHIDEFETAQRCFERLLTVGGETLSASVRRQAHSWKRKCAAEIEAEDEQPLENVTESDVNTILNGASTTSVESLSSQSDVSPASTHTNTPSSVSAHTHTNTSKDTVPGAASAAVAPATGKPLIRHDWYQSPTHVHISIMQKGVNPDDVTVEYGKRSLLVSIKLGEGREYQLDLDPLCGQIQPKKCSYKVLKTKIEVKLAKAEGAAKWNTLEFTGDVVGSVTPWADTSKVDKDSYPTSSKKKINWDSVAKEVEEEKPEGEAALQKLFKDIYAGGSEEQKRAMMKSFQESGGTVLSTNWQDVGARTVECTPPEGLEVHKWEELEKNK